MTRGAASLSAAIEAIDLVNRFPELWPILSELTLGGGVDWQAVLKHLRVLHIRDSPEPIRQRAVAD